MGGRGAAVGVKLPEKAYMEGPWAGQAQQMGSQVPSVPPPPVFGFQPR